DGWSAACWSSYPSWSRASPGRAGGRVAVFRDGIGVEAELGDDELVGEASEPQPVVEGERGSVVDAGVHENGREPSVVHPPQRVDDEVTCVAGAPVGGADRQALEVPVVARRPGDREADDGASVANDSGSMTRRGATDVAQAGGVVAPEWAERVAVDLGRGRQVPGEEGPGRAAGCRRRAGRDRAGQERESIDRCEPVREDDLG